MRRALLLTAVLLVAAPAQAGSTVIGLWSGALVVVEDGETYRSPIVIRITGLDVGSRGGSVRYPGYPCHGRLRVLSAAGSRATFRYRERSNADCTGDDRIRVRLRDDGRLRVRIIAGEAGKAPGTAVLDRR